jgi:putative ABC transport system permease protein
MPSPIPAPPRLPAWLLDRILPQGVRGASIKGDLLEEMAVRARATSIGRARLWYWAQAIAIAVQAAIPRRDYHYEPTDRKASTMESVLADLKFAVRSLSKARGFTVTAVLTLALGIGASTAVFSVANAVLLRPLPFANPDRLMWISEVRKSGTPMSVAWPDYLDWREQSKSFEALAAIQRGIVNFTGTGEPERLDARFVTSGFFDILGVRPALGRTFRPDEDRLGAAPVVLISDALWRRRFDADPNVTGRTMTLGGVPNEIIGVMPAGFRYNLQTDDDVIGSLGQRATPESGLPDRGNHNGVSVIGRLRPGIDENAARRDLDRVAATLRQAYPNTNADTYAQIQSLEQRLVGPIATRIWVLFGAVALLLMLAVVNVANLMVARGLSRRHELSVRAALGGGRWRLVRQLLVESSLLASIGGAAGIVTSAGLIKLFVLTAPEDIPRLADIGMSPAVWLFAFALSAVAALVLGVVPAIQSSAIRGQQALIRAGRGDTAPASAHRLRRGLMTLEVALAIVLLTGAGLMTRTMYAVSTVDPGFDAGGVLTMRYSIAGARSTGAEQTAFNRRVANFGDEVLRTVRALPGVENAALALSLPIEGSQWNSVFIVSDQPVPARANLPISAFSPVSAGYFETLRMRVQSGRVFDGRDGVDAPRTVIVNESFARRFWPGGDAVGKRLKQGWPEGQRRRGADSVTGVPAIFAGSRALRRAHRPRLRSAGAAGPGDPKRRQSARCEPAGVRRADHERSDARRRHAAEHDDGGVRRIRGRRARHGVRRTLRRRVAGRDGTHAGSRRAPGVGCDRWTGREALRRSGRDDGGHRCRGGHRRGTGLVRVRAGFVVQRRADRSAHVCGVRRDIDGHFRRRLLHPGAPRVARESDDYPARRVATTWGRPEVDTPDGVSTPG